METILDWFSTWSHWWGWLLLGGICGIATWYLKVLYAWAEGIWVDGRIREQYFGGIVWVGYWGYMGHADWFYCSARRPVELRGTAPPGPKDQTLLQYSVASVLNSAIAPFECCIGFCLTWTSGIMTVFNLGYDLPTSHRNVLEMVFRVIQITSHEADFPN